MPLRSVEGAKRKVPWFRNTVGVWRGRPRWSPAVRWASAGAYVVIHCHHRLDAAQVTLKEREAYRKPTLLGRNTFAEELNSSAKTARPSSTWAAVFSNPRLIRATPGSSSRGNSVTMAR